MMQQFNSFEYCSSLPKQKLYNQVANAFEDKCQKL